MKKYIIVIGYPKSGNSHTARLLGDILDSPVKSDTHHSGHALADEGFDRTGEYVIKQWHLSVRNVPEEMEWVKTVYIHRDPRDVALSIRDYWKISGLGEVLNPSRVRPASPLIGWPDHLSKWYSKADSVLSFEALINNPEYVLDRVLKDIGAVPVQKISAAVERQSFENRKKQVSNDQPYGSGIQNNLLNKGIVGRWKEDGWLQHHGKLVAGVWFPWMQRLGYEFDPDWWKELPLEDN